MYTFPLTPAQFRHAIYAGLGRAVMHVRVHGGAGLEEIIFDACVRHRAYDPQVDGPRDAWLIHILGHSGHEASLRPRLIGALKTSEDHWDADQLCRLLAAFASRGDAAARTGLYEEFDRQRFDEWWFAGKQLIEVDGVDGLLHVAATLGHRLREDPKFSIDSWIVTIADKVLGPGRCAALISHAAASNAEIELFRAALFDESSERRGGGTINLQAFADSQTAGEAEKAAPELQQRSSVHRSTSFAEIRSRLDQLGPRGFRGRGDFVSWGRVAPDDQLAAAAASLVEEMDREKLKCLLGIFCRRALPFFHPRLLDLVADPEHLIGHSAATALSRTTHPTVRDAAVQGIHTPPLRCRPLMLLRANYVPGDASMIEAALNNTGDEHGTHSVVFDLVELYEHNKLAESLGPLLWAYEASTCSNCRRRAVSTLVELGIAPDWLMEECRLDADAGVREAVGGRRDEFGDEDD